MRGNAYTCGDAHTIIRAADALVRFAGFRYRSGKRGALVRAEPGNGYTFVRFDMLGHARIIRTGLNGYRARHVLRCGSYQYAADVERAVRHWTDDYLPQLYALTLSERNPA